MSRPNDGRLARLRRAVLSSLALPRATMVSRQRKRSDADCAFEEGWTAGYNAALAEVSKAVTAVLGDA